MDQDRDRILVGGPAAGAVPVTGVAGTDDAVDVAVVVAVVFAPAAGMDNCSLNPEIPTNLQRPGGLEKEIVPEKVVVQKFSFLIAGVRHIVEQHAKIFHGSSFAKKNQEYETTFTSDARNFQLISKLGGSRVMNIVLLIASYMLHTFHHDSKGKDDTHGF